MAAPTNPCLDRPLRWSGCLCILLAVLFWGCGAADSTTEEVMVGTPVDPDVFFPPEESSRTSDVTSIAKCLNARGAVLYGAPWCRWTQKQIESFGDAFRYIEYVDCEAHEDTCDERGIESYPTWIIKGKKYSGYRAPAALGDLAGCD